jgi:hypothetical protein
MKAGSTLAANFPLSCLPWRACCVADDRAQPCDTHLLTVLFSTISVTYQAVAIAITLNQSSQADILLMGDMCVSKLI